MKVFKYKILKYFATVGLNDLFMIFKLVDCIKGIDCVHKCSICSNASLRSSLLI